MLILQLTINGLALGAAYALVALGFVLILNATAAVNFAQGDAVMAGGFVAIALAGLLPPDMPWMGLLLLPLVMVAMAVFGLIFCAVAYMPLRHQPPATVFISTIAVGIMLTNGANAIFGSAPRAAPPLLGSGQFVWDLTAGRLTVSHQSLAIIGVAIILVTGLGLVLEKTQTGRRLRASAQDREMARALGIRVDRLTALSFALGLAFAGAAGLLLANQFFVTPSEGGALMLKAYIAVAIGGWGSLRGAVAGAMLIALFEVFVATWLSHPLAEGLLYAALFVILFARPQGLFGPTAQRRA